MYDVIIVGAGPAGIGVAALLLEIGCTNMVILDRYCPGSSFLRWPKEMRMLTPSFTTNFFGQMDINAIISGTSPAFTFNKEHISGPEYAYYLQSTVESFNLPVQYPVEVTKLLPKAGYFSVVTTDRRSIESRFVVWAAGEYQYPNLLPFPGADLCRHSGQVKSWKRLSASEFMVIGGYESGIDAAIHLSEAGKNVTVLADKATWDIKVTDPSLKLSPYTHERLAREYKNKRIRLIGGKKIIRVEQKDDVYRIFPDNGLSVYKINSRPILATGYSGSLELIKGLFAWNGSSSYPLLTKDDESTVVPGLFLAGPRVRHGSVIFCFIYKYRQRFGVIARSIGGKMSLDVAKLDKHRIEGLLMDDLSCCTQQCLC